MIKLKKKLGEGVNGTVYLCEYKGKNMIYKIEKYNNDKSTKSSFIRELEFSKFAKLHKNRFMTLKYHNVIKDCKHKQKLPQGFENFGEKFKIGILNKQKYKYCSVLVYEPVLKYTLNKIRDKLTNEQFIYAFNYLLKSIDLLQKHKYVYNDINGNNIMANSTLSKWYFIDYGAIYKKGWTKNFLDKQAKFNNDYQNLIWIFIEDPFTDYLYNKGLLKNFNYKKYILSLKNSSKFNEIKKMAPRNSKHQKDWNKWYELIIAISYYNIYCQALADGLSTNINIKIPERYMKLKQPNEKLFLNVIKKLRKKHKIIVL